MDAKQATNKKRFTGTVVSDKMDKTVVVAVPRFLKHSKYQKFYKQTKTFKVHDEANTAKVGDKVTIEETKPLSKDKNFTIVG
jgi:small subunit ribosomal protein S17